MSHYSMLDGFMQKLRKAFRSLLRIGDCKAKTTQSNSEIRPRFLLGRNPPEDISVNHPGVPS